MGFNINNILVNSKIDYLEKGTRVRVNSTMRKDLAKDFKGLMKKLKRPQSIAFDVLIEMLKEDEDLLKEFIHRILDY